MRRLALDDFDFAPSAGAVMIGLQADPPSRVPLAAAEKGRIMFDAIRDQDEFLQIASMTDRLVAMP